MDWQTLKAVEHQTPAWKSSIPIQPIREGPGVFSSPFHSIPGWKLFRGVPALLTLVDEGWGRLHRVGRD